MHKDSSPHHLPPTKKRKREAKTGWKKEEGRYDLLLVAAQGKSVMGGGGMGAAMGSGRGLRGVREGHHKGAGQEQAWRSPQGRMEKGTGSKRAPQGASVALAMGEGSSGAAKRRCKLRARESLRNVVQWVMLGTGEEA